MKKILVTAIISWFFIGCAPTLFISNEFGNAEIITHPDSTKDLSVVGIGVMNRDGHSRTEIENMAREHNLKIMKEALDKLSNKTESDNDKTLKCLEQIYQKTPKLHYMSDGTIEAVDTVSASEIKSIQDCINQ